MTKQGYTIYARKLKTSEDKDIFKNAEECYRSKEDYWLISWDHSEATKLPEDAHKLYQPLRRALIEIINVNSDPDLEEIFLPLELHSEQTRVLDTKPRILDFQAAREAKERAERARHTRNIIHLADHLK